MNHAQARYGVFYPGAGSDELVLADLLQVCALLGLGLLAAWLRWGRLGLVAFVGLVRADRPVLARRSARLLASRPVRLLLLALAFFLIGWAGVFSRADLQTLGALLGGGGS